MQRIKRLRVFAGPNGSGKSTVYQDVKKYFREIPFINADEIESHIAKFKLIDLAKYNLNLTSADFTKFLKRNKVYYQILVHPRRPTAMETAEVEQIPGKQVAKVVMAKVDRKNVMLVLPSTYTVDLLKLTNTFGTLDARIEKESEFKDLFPDCEAGAMPPVGRIYHVPCFADKSIEESPEIYFNAGTHTESIKVPTQDFLRAAKAKICDFAVRGKLTGTRAGAAK